MLLYAVVTCLIKRIKYESVFVSMFSTKQSLKSSVYDVIGRRCKNIKNIKVRFTS